MIALRFFLVCAIALGCTACKKDEVTVDMNTSKQISIQMRFSGPELVVKPIDPSQLTEARRRMERLLLQEVHLDVALRNQYGQSIGDSSLQGAFFPKRDFAPDDLRKATWQQM